MNISEIIAVFSLFTAVQTGLWDIWHSGEHVGGQGAQFGQTVASPSKGDPVGDQAALPRWSQALHRWAGPHHTAAWGSSVSKKLPEMTILT